MDSAGTDPRLPTPDSRPPGRGLGRGLGALIPRGQAGLQEQELADSIRQHGVLQPVVVTRAEGGDEYVLIAGERRWRAARLAGLDTIPAIVKEAAGRERLELALVENLQREDLAPLEMAAAYRALIDEHGLTQERVAERVGKSRVVVANALRLLQLPRPASEALSAGQISEGHARALLSAPSEAALLAALAHVIERGLSVRQTEELARRLGEAAGVGGRHPAGGEEEMDAATIRHPPAADPETAYLE